MVTIGICAYNEEGNIGKLLENLLQQRFSNGETLEILVLASGCTDSTETIVEGFTLKDSRVKLISQNRRRGKSSAINLLLKRSEGDIIVFISADNLPFQGSIERLLKPFCDPKVGATTSRPMPVNNPEKFTGFMTHLIWNLHHRISIIQPKLTGELCAIRNGIVEEIPIESMVDDAALEWRVNKKGYIIVYVPEAKTNMRGPDTIKGLIVQRRRIARGFLQMKGEKFNISTYHFSYVIREIINTLVENPRKLPHLSIAIFIELVSRMLASLDAIFRQTPYIWETVPSTKTIAQRAP